MGAFCPEHVVSANKESIIRELVEGKECASQLKLLFQNPSGPHPTSSSAQQLVSKILTSFTRTISVLASSQAGGHQATQILAISSQSGSPLRTSSGIDRTMEESGQRSKRSPPPPPPVAKDRRGCYKRRKTEETRTKISETMEDEFAWRKYGQKEILNSKFPRSYFRCTRKKDEGCKAMKQVQRVQEDPQMFLTTYIGVHTCKHNLKLLPEMVTSDYCSGNNKTSSSIIIKEEGYPKDKDKEDTPLSEITDNNYYHLWSDFELSDHSLDLGVMI